MASVIPAEIPRLMFSMFDPLTITGCVLSALLSARRPELAPTIGPITLDAARQHWSALADLGFTAAALNYEGRTLQPETIAAFRDRFGRSGRTASPASAAS